MHFFITLNIKTGDGLETFGKFLMGNDSKAAYSIFQKLKGNKKVTDKSILTLELMEISHGLPFNIQLMSCTLEEIGRKLQNHHERNI